MTMERRLRLLEAKQPVQTVDPHAKQKLLNLLDAAYERTASEELSPEWLARQSPLVALAWGLNFPGEWPECLSAKIRAIAERGGTTGRLAKFLEAKA